MEEDRKVVVLVISNIEKNVELFRVHIHQHSIRFDDHFAKGIEDHPELSQDMKEVNLLWKNKQIKSEQIFVAMQVLMVKYHHYLKDFYFKEYELDERGHYIEPIDVPKENQPETKSPSKAALHYLYLKQSKRLKKISRKEFESSIPNEEVAEFYVDHYVKKGAKFYKYARMDSQKRMTVWFFMVVNDEFKISFTGAGCE